MFRHRHYDDSLANVIAQENFRRDIERGMPGNSEKIKALVVTFFAAISFGLGFMAAQPFNIIFYTVGVILLVASAALEVYGMTKNGKENKRIRELELELNNNFIVSQTEYFNSLRKLNEEQQKNQDNIKEAQLNNTDRANNNNSNIQNNNDLLTSGSNKGREK